MRRSGTRTDDPSDAVLPREAADEAVPSRARSSRRPPDPADQRVQPNGPGHWPVEVRSVVGSILGLPPLAAVGLAAALTAVGVLVDLLRLGTLGTVFAICYVTGCVLGVAWVRRGTLFWPMVVPPLLMAAVVPLVVLLTGTPRPGAGIAQRLLVIGAPLVNGFPVMAWTTGLALGLGVLRIVIQRPTPTGAGRDEARAGARTSESPRRS